MGDNWDMTDIAPWPNPSIPLSEVWVSTKTRDPNLKDISTAPIFNVGEESTERNKIEIASIYVYKNYIE